MWTAHFKGIIMFVFNWLCRQPFFGSVLLFFQEIECTSSVATSCHSIGSSEFWNFTSVQFMKTWHKKAHMFLQNNKPCWLWKNYAFDPCLLAILRRNKNTSGFSEICASYLVLLQQRKVFFEFLSFLLNPILVLKILNK